MEGLLQDGSSYFYYKSSESSIGWNCVGARSHYPSIHFGRLWLF
ncbi:hypothetical protein ERO13_D03G080050v2 [Gossypium hirsutum]|nr:hypothetical protein ERO13_D03G080050v2 [Gossypium hirsutum]